MPAYFKSWLLFFLVATIGGAVVGGVLGAIIGAILGLNQVPLERIPIITGAVGFLIGIPISFFTFRWAVRTWIVEPLLRSRPLPLPPLPPSQITKPL
jgi:mannitol-specific phosphotransferase system IIBC component